MSQRRPFYGWIVLAASATIVGVGMGALYSLGVFLKPLAEAMGWSRTSISTISLLNWTAMGLGSFLWGALSDRIGTRGVALAGGALLGLGLVLSSQVDALWQIYVTFGFIVGFAVGAFYAPLTSTATKWFTVQRGLAIALVSAGNGIGILAIAPLAQALTNLWGWRVALLVLGDLAWLIVIPTALLIREQPGDVGAAALGGTAPLGTREYTTGEVLRAPQFWAIALTHFACCAAHSGPLFHMVTHASDQGVVAMTAATALGVSGLTSIAGRIGGGVIADRIGAKSTLIALLAVQVSTIVLYLFARDAGAFYGLAVVFGIAYGGVMPLYALVTREYFGEKVMGAAYGAVFLISCLGMGVGSLAGGFLHDRRGSYTWMYLGSAAIGGMAVLMATIFRAPRAALAPAPTGSAAAGSAAG